MLYAIVSDRWVSGLFEHESDARLYLREIPETERAEHPLRQVDGLQYPVYLVEDSTGFRFLTEQAAVDDIKAHAPTADPDECCATLYRFDCDYRPRVAGDDEMGRVAHVHVDNDLLRKVQLEGRAGLRIMSRPSLVDRADLCQGSQAEQAQLSEHFRLSLEQVRRGEFLTAEESLADLERAERDAEGRSED